MLGWVALLALGALAQPEVSVRDFSPASIHNGWSFLTLLGWLWAVVWPVWRLRLLYGGQWWRRLPKAMARIWLLALVTSFGCVALANMFNLLSGAPNDILSGRVFGYAFIFLVLMTMLRTALAMAIMARRWTRTR